MHTGLVIQRHAHLHRGALKRGFRLRFQSNGRPNSRNGEERPNATFKRVTLSSSKEDDQGARQRENERSQGSNTPSLFEQLFPDQRRDAMDRQEEVPELPRMPPTGWWSPEVTEQVLTPPAPSQNDWKESQAARNARSEMLAQHVATGPVRSVLVLRNATKNLLDEDFRRLMPLGNRYRGWQMAMEDLIKVVPGRDIETLEQRNYYYLIFASAMSAYTYQGFVTRLHRLVSQQTPRNMLSPVLPPPGYTVSGIDANEAIEIFTLVPPNHSLDLRQLRPPLTPLVDAILRHEGHPSLVNRPDRLPYEARLTMEGPQLHLSLLRHLFILSGRHRGLSWSGGKESAPHLSQWRTDAQFLAPSPMSSNADAQRWNLRQQSGHFEKADVLAEREVLPWVSLADSDGERRRRTTKKVYIVGFPTEGAMRSFVHFWHRRPLVVKGFEYKFDEGDDDLPPVANVEALW